MLEIKNISKSYSRANKAFFAVKDVSLEIKKGDFIHIIGRSGSGKSTLLNIVAGLLSADSGELLLDRKSTRLNSSHANISYAVFCLKKSKSKEFVCVQLTTV